MQQAPATTVASRPRTGRVADSASVAQAEAIIVRGLSRIKPASKKVAGFQTVRGWHLTLQRDVQGIQVWTEDLDPPESIAPCELYEAHRSRHSNLASHAPRVATGRPARKWRLENAMQLEALISWYANA